MVWIEKRGLSRRSASGYSGLTLPTADEALEEIGTSNVIHFACHGSSSPLSPLDSHLLLQRSSEEGPAVDRLTVSRLSTIAAEGRAWIAFLSACSTAEIKDTKSGDEGRHLTSAFQIAGFPHVIGSLWSVEDNICVRLAEAFYGKLVGQGGGQDVFSNRRVAMAFREAVMHIRAAFSQDPSQWSPFVHFGA